MKHSILTSALLICASTLLPAVADDGIRIDAGSLSVSRATGEAKADGGVSAVAEPYRFRSESVVRDGEGLYDFGDPAEVTTCTNDWDDAHWALKGGFRYRDKKAVYVKNAWLYQFGYPVFWVPYWYYPLNTDYGWRVMPGYRSRWGVYVLTGYVYDIWNEGAGGDYSFGGSTYFDWRAENGVAVGQTVRWNLGAGGKGKIKFYYAWDDDYDRYERHWNDGKHYNYANWGSEVNRERYRIQARHEVDFTERDIARMEVDFLSDSHMMRDFFPKDRDRGSTPVSQAWYEHRENGWAGGIGASGQLADYYGGSQRLPEAWLVVEPAPLFSSRVNYESETRVGYLNRDYARYASEDPMYRYMPYIGWNGRGADYQTFRADTYHRFTLPMKFADVLSVVPRLGYRGTYWNDAGDARTAGTTAAGDSVCRNLGEFGVHISARGTAWLNDEWQHVVEPYLDYAIQEANYTSSDDRRRYVFDAVDDYTDWLDQFGFDGQNPNGNWHGIRPGIRNVFRKKDADGLLRTVLDTDLYAALPFSDESYWDNRATDLLYRYPRDVEDGHYNRTDCVVPGARIRWRPTAKTTLSARGEYDCDAEEWAYADIAFRHFASDTFSWYASYIGRDHQVWDYLPSNHDRWNRELSNVFEIGFEQKLGDRYAWSPFVRYDCRRDEVEECGVWFDVLTDCLGYRFSVEHETGYRRCDGSKYDSDTTFGFFVYLRALGPGSMADLAKF